jgi:hypothetical protein
VEGVNLSKIHCKYFCKCHNVPGYTYDPLIKTKKKHQEKLNEINKK